MEFFVIFVSFQKRSRSFILHLILISWVDLNISKNSLTWHKTKVSINFDIVSTGNAIRFACGGNLSYHLINFMKYFKNNIYIYYTYHCRCWEVSQCIRNTIALTLYFAKILSGGTIFKWLPFLAFPNIFSESHPNNPQTPSWL